MLNFNRYEWIVFAKEPKTQSELLLSQMKWVVMDWDERRGFYAISTREEKSVNEESGGNERRRETSGKLKVLALSAHV